MKPPDHKYIGFDPVKWIERLRHVNETSSFTAAQRSLIEQELSALQKALEQPR